MYDHEDKRGGEKGIERVVVVALPCLQHSVFTRNLTNTQTPYCKPHSQKTAAPLSDFGLTHAPIRAQGLDRKYTVVEKYRGKAATATNKQFGKIAALTRWK